MSKLSLKWSELAPWIAGALVALTVSWAADGIREVVEAWAKGEAIQSWMIVTHFLYVVLFVAAAVWLYRMRKLIFQPRTRFLRNETPEKREHLVLFLSNLNPGRIALAEGIPKEIILTGDLEKDLAALVAWKEQMKQNWPWEMPLRSIKHHLGRLRTITIICSPQSIQQVHWFGGVLRRYDVLRDVSTLVLIREENRPVLATPPKETVTQGGWDFEQFDDLSRAVLHLLQDFKQRRVRDDQIMIDFTGGQKVTSIVAASLTFNRTVKAQYVQTNWPLEVISYDIQLASSEASGLGF
jgi:hypothetical protein